ncbi:MAG TPA: hypothetical protein VGJ50_08160 [Streptosporangiaceae bacterium]|jgi:hypothetical protein
MLARTDQTGTGACGTTTAPAPAAGQAQPDDLFLSRHGDAIDDRVAEMVDELLGERDAQPRPRRLRPALAALGLVLALAATVVLRHDAAAVCTVWPSAAVIYVAAAARRR